MVKECPFCGSIHAEVISREIEGHTLSTIVCPECLAMVGFGGNLTAEEVKEKWNNRIGYGCSKVYN